MLSLYKLMSYLKFAFIQLKSQDDRIKFFESVRVEILWMHFKFKCSVQNVVKKLCKNIRHCVLHERFSLPVLKTTKIFLLVFKLCQCEESSNIKLTWENVSIMILLRYFTEKTVKRRNDFRVGGKRIQIKSNQVNFENQTLYRSLV